MNETGNDKMDIIDPTGKLCFCTPEHRTRFVEAVKRYGIGSDYEKLTLLYCVTVVRDAGVFVEKRHSSLLIRPGGT